MMWDMLMNMWYDHSISCSTYNIKLFIVGNSIQIFIRTLFLLCLPNLKADGHIYVN